MTEPYRTLRYFYREQEARDYRRANGAGGWIFVSEDKRLVVLFPPDMPPSDIFHHRSVKGLTGDLIGCG